MEPKIGIVYKVSLCKTRFVVNEDGTSKMDTPMISFVGDVFTSENSATDYLKKQVIEESATRSQYKDAFVCTYSGRMFSVKVKNVVVLFTYSVVPIEIGIL